METSGEKQFEGEILTGEFSDLDLCVIIWWKITEYLAVTLKTTRVMTTYNKL